MKLHSFECLRAETVNPNAQDGMQEYKWMKFIIINGWERQTRQDRGNSTDDLTITGLKTAYGEGADRLQKHWEEGGLMKEMQYSCGGRAGWGRPYLTIQRFLTIQYFTGCSKTFCSES